MSRPRTLVVAAVVVALVTATAAWALLRTQDEEWSTDGPLILPHLNGFVVRYEVGDVFTDGYQRVKLEGDQPGVLEKVELVGPGMDHFEVLGILLAGPKRRTGALTAYDGFSAHPTDPIARGFGKLVPAEGARLPPGGHRDVVLQIGLKVVKPGLAVRSGVRLYYTVGGKKYMAYQQGSMVLCPDDMTSEECNDAMYKEWEGWGEDE